MPRFAANLNWLFTEVPFLERFAEARRNGFTAVEFPSPYEHAPEAIAERLRAEHLECVLFNLPMGDKSKGDFGIACRPGREAEFREGVMRAIEYAQALGCRRVNCIAGTAQEGEAREALHATLVGNLRHAADKLRDAGIEMVMEPINSVDVPGFFVPRAAEAAALIRNLGHDNFGLQLDIYHTAMMGDDPAAMIRSLLGVIRHVQFADAPGRGEPGTGGVDIKPLFSLLDSLGYAGWISAEYRPSQATALTLDWLN
jgi:hydroxypyruvate isomerase